MAGWSMFVHPQFLDRFSQDEVDFKAWKSLTPGADDLRDWTPNIAMLFFGGKHGEKGGLTWIDYVNLFFVRENIGQIREHDDELN